MKFWVPLVLIVTQWVAADSIFTFHEDFRDLPAHSSSLIEMKDQLAKNSSFLSEGVEVYAALDIRNSVELLDSSIRMLLHHHATSVDSFVRAKYFEEKHLVLSINLLLEHCGKTREKCRKYMNLIRRPSLFQVILNLDETAGAIEAKLGKYRKSESDESDSEDSP